MNDRLRRPRPERDNSSQALENMWRRAACCAAPSFIGHASASVFGAGPGATVFAVALIPRYCNSAAVAPVHQSWVCSVQFFRAGLIRLARCSATETEQLQPERNSNMFCKQCGAQVEDTATSCAKCGTSIGTSNPTGAVADKVKAASKDSFEAFRKFATDPVGGLSVAYESLGAARAFSVGISFGIVFSLCALLAAYRLLPEFVRPPGVGGFFKLLVWACVPYVSLAGACALARLVFRGTGGLSNDTFVSGASLLPFGFVMLLSTLLGAGNFGVISVLVVFALCLTILMLFAGCTRISKMSERSATIAVPLMVILSYWISKIIYNAMVNSNTMFPMSQSFQ